MKKTIAILIVLCMLTVMIPVFSFAEDSPDAAASAPVEGNTVVSRHSAVINGQKLAYTATAGSTVLSSGEDQCEIYYTAYTLDNPAEGSARPVSFAFNGGPGSASLWLHMGFLGPRRIDLDEAGSAKQFPPALVDNTWSILDLTDLVIIDPVGTGYSRALPGSKAETFLGYENDCRTVATSSAGMSTRTGAGLRRST